MTDTKYTPGPWYSWDNDPGLIGVGKAHGNEADLFHVVSESNRSRSEDLANARLAAAAPCLLKDLREAAITLRRYETLHRAKGTVDSNLKAEANAYLAARFEVTIARATGES